MRYRLTKVRLRKADDPGEIVNEYRSLKSVRKWIRRHRRTDNTIELFVLDGDGDLIYFYHRKPLLEEIYRNDGTLTEYLIETGK